MIAVLRDNRKPFRLLCDKVTFLCSFTLDLDVRYLDVHLSEQRLPVHHEELAPHDVVDPAISALIGSLARAVLLGRSALFALRLSRASSSDLAFSTISSLSMLAITFSKNSLLVIVSTFPFFFFFLSTYIYIVSYAQGVVKTFFNFFQTFFVCFLSLFSPLEQLYIIIYHAICQPLFEKKFKKFF